MKEQTERELQTLPRWLTVVFGIILLPIALLCIFGSGLILVAPNVEHSLFTVSIGSLWLVGSVWIFYLSLRLIVINPRSKKRLISSVGLRVSALIFLLIPPVSMLVGTFWEKPILHSAMTVIYVGIAMQLFRIAKGRANAVLES